MYAELRPEAGTRVHAQVSARVHAHASTSSGVPAPEFDKLGPPPPPPPPPPGQNPVSGPEPNPPPPQPPLVQAWRWV